MVDTVKFLHSSDFQLGMTRKFLGDSQTRFTDARDAAIQRLAQLATDNKCEFVVLAGDIFDANTVPDAVYYPAVESFAAFDVPVFLLPGNHDALTEDSILRRLATDVPHVILLEDASLHEVRPGVEVFGAPLHARIPEKEIMTQAVADKEPTAGIRIMVGHGQFQQYDNKPVFDLAPLETALAEGRISYVAMGDTHSAQPIGETGNIWFSGAPEVTDFYDVSEQSGECNSGKALLVTADTKGTVDVAEVAVGTWKFLTYSRTLHGKADLDQLLHEWDELPNKKNCVIKTKVGGTLSLAENEEYTAATQRNTYRFASFFASKHSPEIAVVPSTSELSTLEFSGYVGDVYADLIQESESNPVAARALRQLYSLIQQEGA